MANSSLALYIKPPSIDLGATMQQAEQIRAARTANALGDIRLRQAQGEAGALDQYRMGAQAGDPNATQALTGYPELQDQITSSIAHMDETGQQQALARGQKIGKAALSVSSFPAGSPERIAEWNKQLDTLKSDKVIGDNEYQQWKASGPTDLVLGQAVSMGRTFDQMIADRERAKQTAATEQARSILLGTAPAVIRSEEGFRAKPYDDGGTLRVGYGSDTVTHADGTVEKVTKDTVVTQEDAERDLQRRLPEFAGTAASQVGQDVWSGLDDKAQAALGSVAYNYGSLPDSVVKAAKSGDKEALASAVESLSSNPERRAREAAMIRGAEAPTGSNSGTSPADRRTQLLTVASDPNIDANLRELATTLLKDEKKTPKSYDEMTPDQKLNVEDAARKQVEASIPKYAMDTIPPEELQKQIDAARQQIVSTLFQGETSVKQLTSAPAAAAEAPDGAVQYLRQHPELAPQFDQKYGAGAADAILKAQ